MQIKDIFEKAYDYLISGFLELLKELRKDKVDVIAAIKEAPNNYGQKIQTSIVEQQRAVVSALENLDQINRFDNFYDFRCRGYLYCRY